MSEDLNYSCKICSLSFKDRGDEYVTKFRRIRSECMTKQNKAKLYIATSLSGIIKIGLSCNVDQRIKTVFKLNELDKYYIVAEDQLSLYNICRLEAILLKKSIKYQITDNVKLHNSEYRSISCLPSLFKLINKLNLTIKEINVCQK